MQQKQTQQQQKHLPRAHTHTSRFRPERPVSESNSSPWPHAQRGTTHSPSSSSPLQSRLRPTESAIFDCVDDSPVAVGRSASVPTKGSPRKGASGGGFLNEVSSWSPRYPEWSLPKLVPFPLCGHHNLCHLLKLAAILIFFLPSFRGESSLSGNYLSFSWSSVPGSGCTTKCSVDIATGPDYPSRLSSGFTPEIPYKILLPTKKKKFNLLSVPSLLLF